MRTLLLVIGCLVLPESPLALDFGDYYPLPLGRHWHYSNENNPSDAIVYMVYDPHEIDGQPAVRFGSIEGLNFACWNDGATVTWYNATHEGEFFEFDPDVVLGSFGDGAKFSYHCDATPCDSILIRVWSALDAEDVAIYDMDPAYDDLLVHVYYDATRDPNLHNAILEADLPPGANPPPGAVTDLEWYQRGKGIVAFRDVMAESGELGDKYVLLKILASRDTHWSQVKASYRLR
jgi:hypothetical protein